MTPETNTNTDQKETEQQRIRRETATQILAGIIPIMKKLYGLQNQMRWCDMAAEDAIIQADTLLTKLNETK